jgi:hypothetical protein
MQRAEEAIVPADNPFAKMGLKKLAPGQKKPETPTATWDELLAFRKSAFKLGYASIATAALTAWEWLQREEHLFGAFENRSLSPKGTTEQRLCRSPQNWRRSVVAFVRRNGQGAVSGVGRDKRADSEWSRVPAQSRPSPW